MKIGLVVHAGRQGSTAASDRVSQLLDDRRIDVSHPVDAADVAGLDLVVSLGGDGTLLRAAHLCRDARVPVLGVNLGRLGFLAEVEGDGLEHAMDAVAQGRLEIDERATLEVAVSGPDSQPDQRGWALNEVSIEKTARQRLLLMDVWVRDELFAHVPADALIVATSTGSTAYALSAGGPIVSPRVEATLVVPVAPHTLFDRTLVAGPGEQVRIEVAPDQEPAVVSCDGRPPVVVEAGGSVTAVGGGAPVRLARLGPVPFYSLVRHTFGLR